LRVIGIVACLLASGHGVSGAEESTAPPPDDATAYSGEVLSANFQDVEVRSALQLIADFAGLNLVVGDTVAGRMTLRLADVPWDEALDLVLAVNGLDKRVTGSVLLVAPAEEIAERERAEMERLKDQADLAPLETAFVRMRYADAEALAGLLAREGGGATLSERGRVAVDARTNSVILTDTASNLEAFRRLVEQLDIPVKQVQIEARIVNANSNFTEELGIRFTSAVFTGGAPRADPREQSVDFGVDGLGAANLGIAVTDASLLLDLRLSALAADGEAEIVARPRVITSDKRTATIESGVEIPYQQATKSGATSIAFKDAVLQLEVTPHITPNERIVMDLTVKQDTVGRIFHGVPSINTTRIATEVLVTNGETVVLGGIFQTDRHYTTTRTPLLGRLPFLGRLFQRTLERDDKQELFVFITPSIIDHATDGDRVAEPEAPG